MVFFSHRTKRESPAGEQFWKFSRQCSIFGCTGDQWVAIIFEPWKKRTLHPIREQLNTSTKYNSDSLLSFYSLNFKKQKLNVPSYTCSRRMSSLSFSSPSTSPWTPASSLPGKKKRESVMTRLKNYIVNIQNSKKYKTICSISQILPTSVYILSWSWINHLFSRCIKLKCVTSLCSNSVSSGPLDTTLLPPSPPPIPLQSLCLLADSAITNKITS